MLHPFYAVINEDSAKLGEGGGGDCEHGNAVAPMSSRVSVSVEFCQEVHILNDVIISKAVSETLLLKEI